MDESCPDFLKPRLRLFLSADIIGSTALKQSRLGVLDSTHKPSDASWFTTIQGFYFEAQQHFKSEWSAMRAVHDSEDHFGDEPTLWKTIGDEVLFTKLITDHKQVAITIQCWVNTLKRIRAFLSRDSSRLGVKSTAWIAGFPFRNKEVVLSGESFSRDGVIDDYYRENGLILNKYYSGDKSSINIDYVGPSIDTGFRLTSLSSARKLIVSIDVAYILALTSPTKNGPIDPIFLRYDGLVPLKGVLGGTDYPVFWLDLAEAGSAAIAEDILTNQRPCDRDAAQAFCEAFYTEHADLIFPPFIKSTSESVLRDMPGWYAKHHQALIKNFVESQISSPEPDDVPSSIDSAEFAKKLTAVAQAIARVAEANRQRPGESGSQTSSEPK